MDDKLGELKKNTLIIAISNIGSRAILFMLAPLYSYFLSKSQYGTMDLITTTVSLLGPLFCLDIYEATFRFASDSEEEKKTVYSSSMAVCFLGLLMGLVVIAVSSAVGKGSNLIVFTVLFTVLTVLNNVMSQFARGQGAMKTFALSGIVNAIFLLASNVVFLYFMHMELRGWLLSYFIAKIITFLYLFWRTDFIPDDQVRYYFSAADLIVQPYKTATQSGVTQIAYHFERPMLVTNVGGLAEIVPNGRVGYVCAVNKDDIARAIKAFAAMDKESREKLFSKNIKTEKEKYAWNKMTEVICDL